MSLRRWLAELAPGAQRRVPSLLLADGSVIDLDDVRYARTGGRLIVFGLLGFLLWAAWAPLDKGVPVAGTVKVSGNRKVVQAVASGRVARILVREGELVRQGQPLLRLDDTSSRANLQSLQIQLATTRATIARLVAERDGKPIAFGPGLLGSPDERVIAALVLQRQLQRSRQLALGSEIDAMRELLGGHQAELAGLYETRAAHEQQRQALEEQSSGLRALAQDGFVARNRLLDSERQLAQTTGTLAEEAGRISQIERRIAEQKLHILQRSDQNQAELRAQLADAQVQAESLAERLSQAEYELGHTQLSAPVDGQVVGLSVFTEGAFLQAGERVLEVVPQSGSLIVEAQIPVHLIDRVHAGLPVELSFTAFNQSRTPRLHGELVVVGADRLVDERSGLPFYPAQIALSDDSRRALAKLELRPGMAAEAFVKTGERSLLSYLFKPLLDRSHAALTEE